MVLCFKLLNFNIIFCKSAVLLLSSIVVSLTCAVVILFGK